LKTIDESIRNYEPHRKIRASRGFQKPLLLRADEENNCCPSKEKDEKDEKLFYQFGVHTISI
jgi:hypothetical protein